MMRRAKIMTVFSVAVLGLLALCGSVLGKEADEVQIGDSQILAEKDLQVLFERARDEKTGLEFMQLSLADDHLAIPYFHREMWSSNDKLILCERRGNMNLTYLCNWQEGKAKILDIAWNGQVHVVRSADGQFRELTGKWTKAGKWIPQGLHSHPSLSRQEKFLAHMDGRTGRVRVRVYDLAQLEW